MAGPPILGHPRSLNYPISTMVISKLLGTALAAGAIVIGSSPSFAHGGTYRGPGDTVPPPAGAPGGGAAPPPPGASGPGAPSTDGGSPTTPAPGVPGTGGGTPSTPNTPAPAVTGNTDLGADVSIWDFWWGFNKEPYLNLRSKVRDQGVQSGSDEFFLGEGTQNKKTKSLRPTQQQLSLIHI